MDTSQQQQQSQVTFFRPDRRVLGVVWILKRVMGVITLGSLLNDNVLVAAGFLGLREALSAYTDYASAVNPVSTTQQSTPPPSPTDPV